MTRSWECVSWRRSVAVDVSRCFVAIALAGLAGCTGITPSQPDDTAGFPARPGEGTPPQSIKLVTGQPGLHRVDVSSLVAFLPTSPGLSGGSGFSLMSQGKVVPYARANEGAFLFLAGESPGHFSSQNAFQVEPGAGVAVRDVSVSPPSSWDVQSSYRCRQVIEEKVMARPDLYNNAGDDIWLWSRVSSGQSFPFACPVGLPGLVPGSGGRLTVVVKGGGAGEHLLRVELNGHALEAVSFRGAVQHEQALEVEGSLWHEGTNDLKVFCSKAEGASVSTVFIDRFIIEYQRHLAGPDDQVEFAADPGPLVVAGLTSPDPELWDITDRNDPARVRGFETRAMEGGWTLGFEVPRAGRYLLACRLLDPVAVKPWSGMDLKKPGQRVDYLVLAARDLIEGSSLLAGIRQRQGLRTRVVNTEEAYDAFNYGIMDPDAFISLLNYARDHWEVAPRYVLLVGSGSLDCHNRLGNSENLVPSRPTPALSGGLYASDHYLSDLDGDGKMERAIGRIPATGPDQVAAYCSKILSYEKGGRWRKRVLVMADNRDRGGDYEKDAEMLAGLIRDRTVERVNLAESGATQAAGDLINHMNRGLEMLVFLGHGSAYSMTEEGIFKVKDLEAITNGDRAAIVLALGCLMGAYGLPGSPGLGASLVTGDNGASAFISSAAMVNNREGVALGQALLAGIYGKRGGLRLGDAWVSAHNAQQGGWVAPTYQLLGDPALRLNR